MLQRVQVAVRVRWTPSKTEGCTTLNEGKGFVSVRGSGTYAITNTRRYREDVFLSQDVSNMVTFQRLLLPKLTSATVEHPDTLCLLAYGHTNSGKTHTIAGSDDEAGILTLCIEELIRKNGIAEVSIVEVYMDTVHDLLAEGVVRRIRRRHGPQGATVVVEGLTTCPITSRAQWEAVAKYSMRSRRTAATDRNARSSRSHAIFTIKSRGVRVCLVDLAGSERQTVFSPQLNKESISINRSLSRLSTVLEALSAQKIREDGSRSYVNFRDTVLTVLLQRYLCGASVTTFLACVHPAFEFHEETLSTLRYTQRLKRIRTLVPRLGGPGDVSDIAHNENQDLLEELMQLRQQVKENKDTTELVVQAHLLRIAALENTLEQQRRNNAVLASNASVQPSVRADYVSREKALKAKDTKRVVGWLLSRILGKLPQINVGYDEYFDPFFPPKVQVIGYVSTMACLAPRTADDNRLAFLDVGDLSMGLSMVDASIPPFVRLHSVPCRQCAAWEGQEWDAQGHVLYILAFFEVNEEVMEVITGRYNRLECCGGYLSLESLLPIAIVLCVPTITPSHVKEAVLQKLITLQGEQEAAVRRMSNCIADGDQNTSLDCSLASYSGDGSGASIKVGGVAINGILGPQPNSQEALGDDPFNNSSASSFSKEMLRQSNKSRLIAPFHANVSSSSTLFSVGNSVSMSKRSSFSKHVFDASQGYAAWDAKNVIAANKTTKRQPSKNSCAASHDMSMQINSAVCMSKIHSSPMCVENDLAKRVTSVGEATSPVACLDASRKGKCGRRRGRPQDDAKVADLETCRGCALV